MSFKVLMTYKRILIRHTYTSVISCRSFILVENRDTLRIRSSLVLDSLRSLNPTFVEKP